MKPTHEHKSLHSKYFAYQIGNLKNIKPLQWWNAIKWIAGMRPASATEFFLYKLHIEGHFDHSCELEITNAINAVFLEPMEHYELLHAVTINKEDSSPETAVLSALTKLTPHKVARPDCCIGN